MTYRETRDFLAKHTKLLELADERGGRVVIAPEWQARVMTSTFGGLDGPSFGFVNREYIAAGRRDARFNNYGAEDRLWLAPEGGQFGLFFTPGSDQKSFDDYYTPPSLNEGAWDVVSPPCEPAVRMMRNLQFVNAASTPFNLDAISEVRLLSAGDLGELFGEPLAHAVDRSDVKIVAFAPATSLINRGPNFVQAKGLVSIWILAQLNAGPRTVAIVPFQPGPESELGPAVQSDYCGPIPPERLKITPNAAFFHADGRFRSKIGVSQRRGRDVLGSIDFAAGVLTLARFTLPADPAKHCYLNNKCEVPQAEPFRGDVSNVYNDGPKSGGESYGAYYEIETLSPALELKTGETLTHRHRMVHLAADPQTLRRLAKEILGVDWDSVHKAFF